MPELPEVETIKRDLQKKIVGKKIEDVTINVTKILQKPSLEEFKAKIRGRVIKEINRRGKYIIIDLDSEDKLIIHLGMTGILLYPFNQINKNTIIPKHNHFVFSFTDNTQLVFNDVRRFGKVYLVQNIKESECIIKLGVEPLDESFTIAKFAQMIRNKKNKIKSLLMKQEFITGLGNIYVNEVLHRADIHPLSLASSLSETQIAKLFREIKDVLNEAVNLRGSTVEDEAYRDTDGKKGEFAERLQVYARKGSSCFKCGHIIESIKIEGRSSFFCPKCQKL